MPWWRSSSPSRWSAGRARACSPGSSSGWPWRSSSPSRSIVDGWLTKLTAPIVLYNPEHHLGLRWPWDVPVEDYLFGFAMVASTIVLWERAKRSRRTDRRAPAGGHARPRRGGPVDAGQVTRTEVPEAFDEVAERYDLMVGLSPGYHAQLRASADALLGAIPDAAVVVSAEGESARRLPPAAPARPRAAGRVRRPALSSRPCVGTPAPGGRYRRPSCCGAGCRRLARHARRRTQQGLALVGRLRAGPRRGAGASARARRSTRGRRPRRGARGLPRAQRSRPRRRHRGDPRRASPGRGARRARLLRARSAGCDARSGRRCAGRSSSRSAG